MHFREASLGLKKLQEFDSSKSDTSYELNTLLDVNNKIRQIEFPEKVVGNHAILEDDIIWRFKNKIDPRSFANSDIFIPAQDKESGLALIRMDREEYEQYSAFKSGLDELNSKYGNDLGDVEERGNYLDEYQELVNQCGKDANIIVSGSVNQPIEPPTPERPFPGR